MEPLKRTELDAKKVQAVYKFIDLCDQEAIAVRRKWVENYQMFLYGYKGTNKEEWQSSFSFNKLNPSIRVAAGQLTNTIINQKDWYRLEPKSQDNQKAAILKGAFQKLLDRELERSHFKRHATTFFLTSLISHGSVAVLFEPKLKQNPKYVLEKSRKERDRVAKQLASKVVNPDVEDDFTGEDVVREMFKQLDQITGEDLASEPKEPPYIQEGGVKLVDINHENIYWDTSVSYMEDSPWKAFSWHEPMWKVKHSADLGFYKKKAVDAIGPTANTTNYIQKQRYKKAIKVNTDEVELLAYYGPLVLPNKKTGKQEVVKEQWFCVIANRNTIIKEGEYPFWEPPDHATPIVNTSVRQVPYRATGEGIGDNATDLQKMLDSNMQLINDKFRIGIGGINVIKRTALLDPSQLDEGIRPGMFIDVREEPKKCFDHVELTANLENQVSPINEMFRLGIQEQTGINDQMMGAPNARSRTTAAETNARVQGSQSTVNTIALDLEMNFLIPVLQKYFARILQFIVPEIETNPEIQALLTEEEKMELVKLNEDSRYEILNQWYGFEVKGFSAKNEKNEMLMRVNEFFQVASSNPSMANEVNWRGAIQEYCKLAELDPKMFLLNTESEFAQIQYENALLGKNKLIQPAETDNHELHMQQHMALVNGPYATEAAMQHLQMHQQIFQMIQMQQQQSQALSANGGQPPQQMLPQ